MDSIFTAAGWSEEPGNQLRHTLTVLIAAAYWDRRRCGFEDSPWTLIGMYTRGQAGTGARNSAPDGGGAAPALSNCVPAADTRHHQGRLGGTHPADGTPREMEIDVGGTGYS